VVTQEYLADIRTNGKNLFQLPTIKELLQIAYNANLAGAIAFHYQAKWALEVINRIRSSKTYFDYLMYDINGEE
jgi:hypothetical protein